MAAPTLPAPLQRVDRRLVRWMDEHAAALLRWSLALVLVWFGALKLAGVSPVVDLVAKTLPWLPPGVLIPALGAFEVVLGALLAWGRLLRVTLALFWAQMAGTFLVLLLRPDVAFQGGNPLLLTVEGEFVVKNVVLAAAGIAIGGSLRREEKGRAPTGGRSSTPSRAPRTR